ncbi:helix-turn-helix domain-containing protein [Streptomyces turgidiscabies]|uniref:helix-turn-helix domain-containing protein n=1 Tax=Streptomyces turgidiscabies TaxID=85558 RepID=UPI0038F6B69A
MYKLIDRDLLRRLMKRTGTGASISVRPLADLVGVPHGTIGNLLTGHQESVPSDVAHRIARVIGVALLILWEPPPTPDEQADVPTLAPTAVTV